MTWQRVEPLVSEAGDVGGDGQVGEAYDAKWVRQMPDGRWSVVYRSYYVSEADGVQTMAEKTDYLVCAAPGDPGGTEVASNDAYAVVTSLPPLDDAAVRDAAREAYGPTRAEWNNAMSAWQVS